MPLLIISVPSRGCSKRCARHDIKRVRSVVPYEPVPTNEVVPVMLVTVLHRDLVAISKFKVIYVSPSYLC